MYCITGNVITRTSPAGHGGAAGHGKHSTGRCGGPMKPPGEIQVPARGPPHVCYKGENRDLPRIIDALNFIFDRVDHQERWPLVSLCARKKYCKILGESLFKRKLGDWRGVAVYSGTCKNDLGTETAHRRNAPAARKTVVHGRFGLLLGQAQFLLPPRFW